MQRMFYDEMSESVISFEEVEQLYKEAIENGFTESESFGEFFLNSQSYNNGTLTEVYKFKMIVWFEDENCKKEIVAIGSNPKNACMWYGIDNDISEYPVIISSEIIDF